MQHPHPRTWYVVTDGGHARFLRKQDGYDTFDTLRVFAAEDSHLHTHELGLDRPGRTHESVGATRHAIQPRQDLHEAAKKDFVDEVAKALNAANALNEFDGLILVAPAHALNELNHALDAPTKLKIKSQLQKDLTKVPNADLAKHFVGMAGV